MSFGLISGRTRNLIQRGAASEVKREVEREAAEPAFRLLPLAEAHHARDEVALDLARAVADDEEPRVAEVALDVEFQREAAEGCQRGPLHAGDPLVHEPGRPVEQQTGGGGADLEIHQHVADRLERADGLAGPVPRRGSWRLSSPPQDLLHSA